MNVRTKKKRLLVLFIAVLVTVLFTTVIIAYGYVTGTIQHSAAYIKCGHPPVAATSFAAAYSYDLPTDATYQPSMVSEYFCSEQEAIEAGYHKNPLAEQLQ